MGSMVRYLLFAVLLSLFALAARDTTYPGTRVKYVRRWGNPGVAASVLEGGYRSDAVTSVAVDAAGHVYVAGRTYSEGFPRSAPESGGYLVPRPTGFVGMLKPDGSDFVWLTTWDKCGVNAMAVDASGNVVVAGATYISGGEAFLAKFDASGSVLFTRQLSGPPTAVGTDASGNIYVAGTTFSSDYPTTSGALQETRKNASTGLATGFVSKFDPTGSTLLYSTYLGGSQMTEIHAMSVDAAGFAYLAGTTTSTDFPTSAGGLQPHIVEDPVSQQSDGFVAKLSLTGAHLVFSTYLGGSGPDSVNGIAIDASGNSYVAGSANSTSFPVTRGAFLTTGPSIAPAFVSKLNNVGTALVYSTYYGGSATAAAVAVDRNGWAYVTGETPGELPVWAAIQPSYYGGKCYTPSTSSSAPSGAFACPDGFVAAFNENGSGLAFSTYLSGAGRKSGLALAVDAQSNVYIGGHGAIMPPTSNFSATDGTAFLLKLGPGSKPPLFTRQSITNAANFSTGLPLPGGAATIFVGDLAGTDNVTVKIDGVPAPLYAVTPRQINFQVPFETTLETSRVEVSRGDAVASVVGVKNFTTAPAIFTQDGVYGAIQHGLDYRLVTPSAPAERGEVVTIYLTGLGAVTPALASGTPAPLAPLSRTNLAPTVFMGGQTAQVLFSGLTPGIFGLYQINARIPEMAASGNVEVQVSLPQVYDINSQPCVISGQTVLRVSQAVRMPIR